MTTVEPLIPNVLSLAKADPAIAIAVNFRYLGGLANALNNLSPLISRKVMHQPIGNEQQPNRVAYLKLARHS
jgi:hypothetical protein